MAFSETLVSETTVSKTLVVLGLGSNLPYNGKESRALLEEAIAALERVLLFLKHSSFYQTKPIGPEDQPRYLNACAAGFYGGDAPRLLAEIQKIESALGRDRARERRWGERTLDIDILLFGDSVVSNPPLLEIPHPRLKERRFALEPLLEICPGAAEPGTGVLYQSVCDSLPPQGVVRLS